MNIIWNHIELVIRKEISNLNRIRNAMCPLKRIKVVGRNDPWITQEITELMRDKNDLKKKAKKSNSPEDWARARALRNLVNKSVTHAKRDFIIDHLKRHERDSKKFWETVGLKRDGGKPLNTRKL